MQLDSTYNTYLKSSVLSSNQTKELIKAYREGDRKALDKIVQGNQKLILALAKKYTSNGIEYEDLVQEGNIGLMKAVDKFDLNRETAFGTYASEWILQFIRRSIEDKGSLIRLPAHRYQLKLRALRTKAELSIALGREATNEEIAEKLNVKPSLVYEIIRCSCDMKSLDEQNTNNRNEEAGNLLEIIEDESVNVKFHLAELSDARKLIEQAIRPFNARQQYVIKARFGMDDGEPKTLREVANELGITFERVRQIQDQAMRKIRSSRTTMNKLRGCI